MLTGDTGLIAIRRAVLDKLDTPPPSRYRSACGLHNQERPLSMTIARRIWRFLMAVKDALALLFLLNLRRLTARLQLTRSQ